MCGVCSVHDYIYDVCTRTHHKIYGKDEAKSPNITVGFQRSWIYLSIYLARKIVIHSDPHLYDAYVGWMYEVDVYFLCHIIMWLFWFVEDSWMQSINSYICIINPLFPPYLNYNQIQTERFDNQQRKMWVNLRIPAQTPINLIYQSLQGCICTRII